jgi:hypothetical protein
MIAQQQEAGAIGKIRQSLAQKYGYYAGPPGASGGGVKCPFDFISDYIRGFTGILNDIRRIPKKVQEACEAILPYLIHKATPKNPSPFGTITITTHMPAFMRTKDFETLYYPTFKKMIEAFAQQGSGVTVFCESDWMRYLDHLQDLPPNTRLWFESGDPKLAKQKIGDKQILTGFYPLTLLQTGTKQAVVDKAKEIVDILAPGGRYYFDFDKGPIACQDNTRDNLIALSEYLWNNTNY